MSDLDKAIRAELETGYWRLSRQTSTAADRGALAIIGVLAWARGLESTLLGQTAVGKIPDDLRRIIASSLGVSGEDRSEPTPAPEPAANAARCDRLTDHAGFCLKRCTKTSGCTERARHRGKCTTGLWSSIAQSWASTGDTRCTNPVSEVVTPEGPA